MATQSKARSKNSTIVRILKSLPLRLMRSAFSFLERFAPVIGGWWAERLWFLHQGPLGAIARRPGNLDRGESFRVAFQDREIVGESWGRGRNIYLVHGWGGWGAQLGAFVAPLVNAGYRVVTFDMPSHGASDPGSLGPRRSTIVEFAEAFKAVVHAQGPAHALIAHSLGSTASAIALRDGMQVELAVLIAPMADPVPYTKHWARLLGFGERIRSRLERRIERRVGLPMAYFNVPRMAHDFRPPQTLVIHDRDDREVAYTDGQAIANAWPRVSLITTTGLGHVKILQRDSVVAAAAAFVAPIARSSEPAQEKVRQLPQRSAAQPIPSTTIQESA